MPITALITFISLLSAFVTGPPEPPIQPPAAVAVGTVFTLQVQCTGFQSMKKPGLDSFGSERGRLVRGSEGPPAAVSAARRWGPQHRGPRSST